MAFKNCFYLQFLKDDTPGIDFVANDFTWQQEGLKPDMYFGYEKPDGSEPDWKKIGPNAGEVLHIDVTIGQKIYFKGTMPMANIYWNGGNTIPGYTKPGWFHLERKHQNTYLKFGGCPLSLMHDGDGTTTLPILPPVGQQYPSFAEMGAYFPGTLNLSDFIFPENTADSAGLFIYCFVSTKCIEHIPQKAFPKHKLGVFEYSTMFQGVKINGEVWLPFTDDDLAMRCFYAMFIYGAVDGIHVNFTSWNGSTNSPTRNWIPSNTGGKFYGPDALPDQRGGYYIPNGWLFNARSDISATFAAAHKLRGKRI